MHLLDTDVLWALRQPSAGTGNALADWAADVAPNSLYISVVNLMDLETGAARLERRDKGAASAVRAWMNGQVRRTFEGRILPIDASIAARSAGLGYADARDGLIAATAIEHGMTLATGNPAAFKLGRVRTLNPWKYRPKPPELDWQVGPPMGSPWLRSLFR